MVSAEPQHTPVDGVALPAPALRANEGDPGRSDAESGDEKSTKSDSSGPAALEAGNIKIDGEDAAATFLRTVDLKSILESSTPEVVDKLRKRIDYRVLPLLIVTYAMQNVDKSTLSSAAAFTLQTDLKLVGKQYSWLSSLFYFAYLFFEYPTTVLSQKFPLGKFVGVCITVWGGILMCGAAAHNFTQMAVLRFLLGIFESAITPTFVLINSMWYLRQEQALRDAAFCSGNGLGSIYGGILNFGLGHISAGGLSPWRWIYLINGALTVLWGVFFFFNLPSSPMEAKFLTPEEKALLIHRIRGNKTGILNRQIKWYQAREAFSPWKDPQGLLFFLIIFCNELLNGSLGSFSSLIYKSFGFTSLQTTLLGIPTGAINFIGILGAGWVATHFKNARIYTAMFMLLPTMTGLILQIALPRSNIGGLLAGTYLFPPYAACLFLTLGIPGVNGGGYTKRVTLSSFAFLGYATGNIAGPFFVKNGENPPYRSIFVGDLVAICLQLFFLGLLRWHYVRENARRDALLAAGQVQDLASDELADKTDLEIPGFRYQL
ncbi:hypothetical protein MNV49_003253 [Pseudohyphozyma bogoriensis]|nr:hypothetical protein MNV49_003253 [Pseudohyphozyma bogoriensis]